MLTKEKIKSLSFDKLNDYKKVIDAQSEMIRKEISGRPESISDKLSLATGASKEYLLENLNFYEDTYGVFDYRKNMMDYSGVEFGLVGDEETSEIRYGSNWCYAHMEFDDGAEPGFNEEFHPDEELVEKISVCSSSKEKLISLEEEHSRFDIVTHILLMDNGWV